MATSSSRTGTTGERGDARGMGIGVEECDQRAGPYVTSFARAACTVQHLAPCSQGAISRAGNISTVFPVSWARRLLRKPLLELTMKALVAAVSACLLFAVQGAARAAAGDEVYARPGQLVAADGTRLNLYCTGRGSPAVVFDSGWEDWAPASTIGQPEAARLTRAGSYDRAGAGFSDAGRMPRTSVRIADEL